MYAACPPSLPAPQSLEVTFPETNAGDFEVEPDQTVTLAPGAYGTVRVKSRATVQLSPGTYYFDALEALEPDARLEVAPGADPPTVYVRSRIFYRGTFVEPDGDLAQVFLGYTGSQPVYLESPFRGVFVAPYALVVVRADFTGQLSAADIDVDAGETVTCEVMAAEELVSGLCGDGIVDPGEACDDGNTTDGDGCSSACEIETSCSDGVQNGTESDVDCGGDCSPCSDGRACNSDSDCQSGNCDNGVCQPAIGGDVSALIEVQTDWGSGYCVGLVVSNDGDVPIGSWVVVLEVPQASMYTSWNGQFSQSGQQYTVEDVGWNGSLQPGQSTSETGFCANRTGGSELPSIVSASGQ